MAATVEPGAGSPLNSGAAAAAGGDGGGGGPQGAGAVTDLVIALALAAVGVGFSLRGLGLGVNLGDTTSAGLAPFVFGVALALPAVAIGVHSARALRGRGETRGENQPKPSRTLLRGPALGLVAITAYTLLLPRVGYLLATFAFTLALLFLLGWRSLRGVLAAMLLTAAVYGLFSVALRVPLPSGPFP